MSWLRREELERLEAERLAPCATASTQSGGRRFAQSEDPLRTAFQRDRDRILHSTAFRRLQHKTQVFAADEGDHYRSRMTHSLEVSQLARSAALALRLNADLAEAVALAHDLGHPPFGHVGEEVLHELMTDDGGFRHNAQGARIVDVLEDQHGLGQGLNLTKALRASLLKGVIPDGFPLSEDLSPRGDPPIEASLVDRCDKIAYLCHDLDDAIRAGLIETEDATDLSLWRDAATMVGSAQTSRVYSGIVKILLHDLISASDASIAEAAPHSRPRIRHSDAVVVKSQELLAFLRDRFYRSERVLEAMDTGRRKIESCFQQLLEHPEGLPDRMRDLVDAYGLRRVVCDYVAGMTDRYLMRQ